MSARKADGWKFEDLRADDILFRTPHLSWLVPIERVNTDTDLAREMNRIYEENREALQPKQILNAVAASGEYSP